MEKGYKGLQKEWFLVSSAHQIVKLWLKCSKSSSDAMQSQETQIKRVKVHLMQMMIAQQKESITIDKSKKTLVQQLPVAGHK